MSPASAATINIAPGLQNYDIQNLINGSTQGDTINFLGNSYSNISLIINKKLNIISNKNTIIISNNSNHIFGLGTFAFYFTTNSLGSIISGFNIRANSDYGIIAKNVRNITINFNNISGSHQDAIYLKNVSNINLNQNNLSNSGGNGLNIKNSKNVSAYKNHIKNNNYSGINVSDSSNIKITYNNVIGNNLSGLSVYSSKNVSVKNNSLENNKYGAYLSNTYNVNITGNKIKKNQINGISLEDTTENTFIAQNNITSNINGIYIDSYSVNDTIINNTIENSVKSAETYIDVSDTGDGIGLGDNYQESHNLINIIYNVIVGNQNFNVKSNPQYSEFNVGANWYGTNNREDIRVCPMVCTAMITSNGIDYYSGNSVVNSYMPGYFNSANSNGTSNNGNSNGTSNNGNSNGTSNNGNSNDTSKSDGNSSSDYLNSLNSSSSVTQQVTNLIGIIGKSLSNEGRAGSNGNGLKFIEVSIKDTINTIKNNPYTILAIFALLALIGLGYFKRAKFN
jgi:parallel beta-helix repeat protein